MVHTQSYYVFLESQYQLHLMQNDIHCLLALMSLRHKVPQHRVMCCVNLTIYVSLWKVQNYFILVRQNMWRRLTYSPNFDGNIRHVHTFYFHNLDQLLTSSHTLVFHNSQLIINNDGCKFPWITYSLQCTYTISIL